MLMFGLGTCTPGSGSPKNCAQGYGQHKLAEFCPDWMLQWAFHQARALEHGLGFAAGLDYTECLDFAAGD